ncbi:LOB domain-containing protein 40 [Eucalyptus grandis]|uniref:LOB domain-containing protein 40 n=1 Tax=Eucalyptus grandis TaxID=71139 RepID=UPI000527E589|nr:LOB domain-containing protein 40 [Eucalyptus grandis]
MKGSCNGCRVLRKACGDDCPIRPCLHWIKTSPSQSNATLFLAKFYGRAGLLNLLLSGPAHLRPSIFKSLLYEACGRIVNPIYGSVGLLWSGSWHLCQAAVDAVLAGDPIARVSSESAIGCATPPLEAGDIRHVPKTKPSAAHPDQLRKVRSRRRRFKRSAPKTRHEEAEEAGGDGADSDEPASRDSRGSRGSAADRELAEAEAGERAADGDDSELELTLRLEPRRARRASEEPQRDQITGVCDGDTRVLSSGLDVRRRL